MSGSDIAEAVAGAYAEAGIAAGNGIGAVSVTIKRAGVATGDAWNPTPGSPASHTFVAKPGEKQYMQRPGAAIEQGERVYSLVNYGVTIAPTTADVLTVDSVDWPVTEVIAIDYAGYTVSWLVKVAR